jgi:Ser/Thr protein kinase RdoA (MazF antagonist)
MPSAIVHSTFSAAYLADYVQTNYNLTAPVECILWSPGFNDHYLIRTATQKYMLRVYRHEKYWVKSVDDIRFELELLQHLHARNIGVIHPIARADSDFLGTLEAPEGTRQVALFTFAEGDYLREIPLEKHRLVGETMAKFHLAADEFVTDLPRYHLDTKILLDQPLFYMHKLPPEARPADFAPILQKAQELQTWSQQQPTTKPEYGIIHADMHGRNHFYNDAGITIFDFDHCGYGWRAYDLAGYVLGRKEDARQAFLDGYQTIRALSSAELDSLPTFEKIRRFWDAGDVLASGKTFGVGWLSSLYWENLIEQLNK